MYLFDRSDTGAETFHGEGSGLSDEFIGIYPNWYILVYILIGIYWIYPPTSFEFTSVTIGTFLRPIL